MLTTGAVTGDAESPDVVRVVGSGSYVIEHGLMDCGWAGNGNRDQCGWSAGAAAAYF